VGLRRRREGRVRFRREDGVRRRRRRREGRVRFDVCELVGVCRQDSGLRGQRPAAGALRRAAAAAAAAACRRRRCVGEILGSACVLKVLVELSGSRR
jgi:hypothetical protein